VAFAWNTPLGNPFSYRSFNYPLKSFLVIYQFLYSSEVSPDQEEEGSKAGEKLTS
jgi:hypothetical protein